MGGKGLDTGQELDMYWGGMRHFIGYGWEGIV